MKLCKRSHLKFSADLVLLLTNVYLIHIRCRTNEDQILIERRDKNNKKTTGLLPFNFV